MYLACSPITWGALRRRGEDAPYSGIDGYGRVLDEIRAAGYSHVTASVRLSAEPGAAGDPLATPEGQRRFLAGHGLEPAPGATGGYALRDRTQRAANVDGVRRVAAFTRALGLDAVFIMPEPSASHRQAPGHYPRGGRPDRPSRDEVAATCDTLDAMGEACRAEGVWLCLHNHAGMLWETEDEFDDVIAGTDPASVALGPDVGHMAWGGIDPLPWFEQHMARVKAIHIKDVDAGVLRRVREEKLTYAQGMEHNIWVEIGSGCVDWPALFTFWRQAGYAGAVVVESDRTPLATPQESVAQSRRYVKEIAGI